MYLYIYIFIYLCTYILVYLYMSICIYITIGKDGIRQSHHSTGGTDCEQKRGVGENC
jgi:hypothetical protein